MPPPFHDSRRYVLAEALTIPSHSVIIRRIIHHRMVRGAMNDTNLASQGNTPSAAADVAGPAGLLEALVAKRGKLVHALDALDGEIAEAQQELSRRLGEARDRREPLEEALSHLDALLRIEGWVPPDQKSTPNSYSGNSVAPIQAAHDLLSKLGKPLHYRELVQKLTENGVHVTGKDPAATLLSQMSRDARFKRAPERGRYGLASWRMRKSTSKAGKAKRKRGKKAGKATAAGGPR